MVKPKTLASGNDRLRTGRYVRPATRAASADKNPDHWSISYLDLVTLLLTLFVLLFAMQSGKQQAPVQTTVVAEQPTPTTPYKVAYSALPQHIGKNPVPVIGWAALQNPPDPAPVTPPALVAKLIPATERIRLPVTPISGFELPKPVIPLVIAKITPRADSSGAEIPDLVEGLQSSVFADSIVVRQSENIATLEMKDRILFEPGDEQVRAEGGRLLGYLASYLQSGKLRASIEGHTDNQPIRNSRYRSNWELSTARAVAVTHQLIALGVDPQLITASGLADTHPVADNNSADGRSRNRRVTIILRPRDHSPG